MLFANRLVSMDKGASPLCLPNKFNNLNNSTHKMDMKNHCFSNGNEVGTVNIVMGLKLCFELNTIELVY